MPRWSDSATFSAACRQTLHERKRLSPSFHSLVCLSRYRGVDAMRNFATAAPLGVNRSSGSSTRLPINVMLVSPAAMVRLLLRVRSDELGAQHCLVEVELTVELFDGGRLGGDVEDGVDAFDLLVDLEGEAATAPDVDLLHRAAALADDAQELVEGRGDGALLEIRIEDAHQFVTAHEKRSPPADSVTRRPGAGGRPRSVRGRRGSLAIAGSDALGSVARLAAGVPTPDRRETTQSRRHFGGCPQPVRPG